MQLYRKKMSEPKRPRTRRPRSQKNYINGRTFYEHLVVYQSFAKEGKEAPRKIMNYIGEAIILIANKLTKHSRFYAYTEDYKQEMVSDAIEKCIEKIGNFDVDHPTENPFAYFTQICWNAFVNRADKEGKQHYVKHKNFDIMHQIDLINENMLSYDKNVTFNADYHNNVIEEYERKIEDQIKAKKNKKIPAELAEIFPEFCKGNDNEPE